MLNVNEPSRMIYERNGIEKDRKKMPKIIVGIAGTTGLKLEHAFRQLGWRVSAACDAGEIRAMAQKCHAAVVVLPVSQFAESGFLTCAKLVLDMPKAKVWLVGPGEEELERFALFAGAAGYLPEGMSVAEMVELMSQSHAPTSR